MKKKKLKRTTPFYADLKRICETTNWEAGSCMQNEKLIHSFKNKNKETTNSKMKTNTKKKHDDTNTTTCENYFNDTNTTTWGNIWKIAKFVQ